MKQRRRDGERGDAEKERNVEGVGRRRRFGLSVRSGQEKRVPKRVELMSR